MPPPGFLDLPITIRNQIYSDLLVPDRIPSTTIFFDPININILFTNRQIYAESSDVFYSRNLFVCIETNDPGLVFDVPAENVTIFARDSINVRNCDRIAMTVEMYMFDNRLSETSRPAFVVTAAALPSLFHELWMPKLYIWSMQASLSIDITCRFSFTHEVLEKLLIEPLVDAFLCPTFAGILSLDPTISDKHVAKFFKRFIGSYEPRGTIAKLESLRNGAAQKAKTGAWIEAAGIYSMAIRYAQMVWKCHMITLQDDRSVSQDLQTVFWSFTADVYADRIIVLINKAKEGLDGDSYYQQARHSAEEGIEYLNGQHPSSNSQIDTTTVEFHRGVEKRKAKIAYRASVACEALGDRDAAVEYVQQCLKYEPETKIKLTKRIEDLLTGEQKVTGSKAVVWGGDDISPALDEGRDSSMPTDA